MAASVSAWWWLQGNPNPEVHFGFLEDFAMTDAPAAAVPLSLRLREATATAHQAAERTAFVRRMFKGTLPRNAYAALLRSLHPVYTALEAGLRSAAATPAVAHIWDPALERAASLEEDLGFYTGPTWREVAVVEPANRYAAHLKGLAVSDPARLVAHAYVRYLGDLSGGQMIGKAIARHYNSGPDGIRFYEFDDVPDPDSRKQGYRQALDTLPLDQPGREAVVEEASRGFDFAREIFEALERDHPAKVEEA